MTYSLTDNQDLGPNVVRFPGTPAEPKTRIVHAGMWALKVVVHKKHQWVGVVMHAVEIGPETKLVVQSEGISRVVSKDEVEPMLTKGRIG